MAADKPENIRDFSRSLPMALLRAREAAMERFRPSLRAHKLTDQQWRVLRALFDHGQKDLGELAEMCCLLKPSITRIIRSMESRQWLIKRADAKDQRRTIVSITAEGREMIAKVGPISEQVYAEIAADFGPDELEDLYRKLDTLVEKLAKQ
ncbi:MAG: homoprotocatechuate degradation operon regulator HpaR [Rhodospirillaceae bacterium]|jgi:homoprotocatechuate degradation regulator HpaR|nr:homoprotocatechuate degradation operon regulator HpaR [Rhodospirillaceae bacterium]MBT7957003.1 homoprotocatechuate degradation operon regulator HpaR [Rhodospirillaceae bacterium]